MVGYLLSRDVMRRLDVGKDQYNTMLKDNVHGQKVKSCTIEINTIQNAQRCPGARSK